MYAKLVLDPDGRKRYEPVTDFDRSLYRECSELLRTRQSRLLLPQGKLADGENTRRYSHGRRNCRPSSKVTSRTRETW